VDDLTKNEWFSLWIASFLAITAIRIVIARNEAIQKIVMNNSGKDK